MERGISTMATKKELEELGRKFIDLEIEVLNKTNTSIFENGVYNEQFLSIAEWSKGIKEFLMFEKYSNNNEATREFYQCLAELINKAYIRYKESLSNVDRLNLKVYLQITEILEQEQKIYDLERYQSSKEVIEAQEHLNNIVLSSYMNQLTKIKEVMKSDPMKEALQKVIENKEQKEVKESFSEAELKDFEYLYNLTKKGNETKLQEEIKKAQQSIDEAKKRQSRYEKQKIDNEKRRYNNNGNLEELKSNKNAIHNFFSNKQAVDSTIKVLENCLDYYYSLMFLNEFMTSLTIIDIQNQFYFMKPLDLMSYSKLEGGLEDILTVLHYKKIKSSSFENVAYKYISLSLFDNDKFYTASDSIKEKQKECQKIISELRSNLYNALQIKNRKDIVRNVAELENNFIKALKEEKGW